MKRLVLGIVALTSITQAMALQVGGHLGMNLGGASATTGGVDQTIETKAGFMVGGWVELGIAPLISIQPELNYVTKYTSTSYLCIPILAKVKFTTNFVNPYIVAGPDIGLKMSAPAGSTIKGTDFALDFGGGAEFPINALTAITVDVRYSMGLTNVLDNPAAGDSYKNKGIQIMAGVAFGM